MLTHLSINNFTLVTQLDIELRHGMTTITGETGAGKSILLDALGLTLGDRSGAEKVRPGADRADISACFEIKHNKRARRWLEENDLNTGGECILRRVVTTEGRSKGYINGQPATMQQLRALGEMLIDIHSQHEHQSLLKKETHRRLLDEFAGHNTLVKSVQQAYRHWQTVQERFFHLRDNAEENNARYQLLSYQIEELDQLSIQENELEQLEAEQKTLANAESILQNSHQLSALCSNEEFGLQEALNKALHCLHTMPQPLPSLKEAELLLNNALINVEEAHREVEQHINQFDLNPQRLQDVEQRLSTIYEIARKHRVQASQLTQLHQSLQEELTGLAGNDAQLDALQHEVETLSEHYHEQAAKLSVQRQKATKKISTSINRQLKELAMNHAKLEVALHAISDKPAAYGLEEVEFLISTNPGQPARPLAKVASGGELSRVSLAIQVVTAQTSATPALVFDEVDVGIGGATADKVGKLLRALGEQGQVICVTHLAQVASKAHAHLLVTKQAQKKSTHSLMKTIMGEDKIAEIARMIGGEAISDQSRAHAREMLGSYAI